MLKNRSAVRLGEGSIVRLVLSLAIPSMLAQFVNVAYGIVDRIYRKFTGNRRSRSWRSWSLRTAHNDNFLLCLSCRSWRRSACGYQIG